MTELTDPPWRIGTEPPDEAIERSLSRMRRQLEPDPHFRRRLRGVVVNRHVAVREGLHREPDRPRRRMGQLGRASLYATFILTASASSVMAASEQALPGDLLYPIKREIEELRLLVLPTHLHDDLQAAMLAERIDEMRRLAAAGEWSAVSALATEVGALGDAASELDGAQLIVLGQVVNQVPAPARSTVEDAIEEAGISVVDLQPTPSPAPTNSPAPTVSPSATPSPAPTNSPAPTVSPSATPSPAPTNSPAPTVSPSATPSPAPTVSPSATPDSPNGDD